MTTDHLKQRFIAFNSTQPADAIEVAWSRIYMAYMESQRHYHTLHHISDILRQFDQVASLVKNPPVVAMAIYYHDIVYHPGSAHNEEESAVIAEEELRRLKWKERDIREVAAYIRSTKDHTHDPAVLDPGDLQVFLDLDLSILGSDWDTYRTYAQNILREFGNNAMVKWGRSNFMERFLQKKNIFHSGYFQKKFESAARENIQREINELLK